MKRLSNGLFIQDTDTHFQKVLDDHPGGYQTKALTSALAYVDNFRVAIDVGAHVGLITYQLAPMFDSVIAIEGHPKTYDCLMTNFANRPCNNVACQNYFIGNPNVIAAYKVYSPENTGATELTPALLNKGIPLRALDYYERDDIDFIKIDVQGMEMDILKSATRLLKYTEAVWMIECVETRPRVTAFMEKYGYSNIANHKKEAFYKHYLS